MRKKIILGLAILLTGLLAVACDFNGEEVIVGDFSLTVTVDKTRAKVGDTVTATVVFKNLSDKDIEAEIPGWIAEKGGRSKEDILDAFFSRPPEESLVVFCPPDIVFEPRPKIMIESGTVIKREFKHIITKSEYLCAYATAHFISNTDTADPFDVRILCTSRTIKVR